MCLYITHPGLPERPEYALVGVGFITHVRLSDPGRGAPTNQDGEF